MLRHYETATDVDRLVASVTDAGIAIPPSISRRLYEETEGLPFFLSEYLTTISRSLQSGEAADWSLPGTVRDVLQARLTAADETGLQLLSAASVIGRSFDFDTLREASGRGEEETIHALEVLLNEGLIQEVSEAAADQRLVYDFMHQKLRALVYDQTSLARRRLLHRRVAEVLSRSRAYRDSRAIASQIAYHYQMAGQESEAAEYYQRAGEYARELYANEEAVRYFQSALGLGHASAPALHEAIGDLQTLLGEYAAALRSYETSAALCDTSQLAIVEHKIGGLHHRRGDWDQAHSHYDAALSLLDEGSEMARLYADWSLNAHRSGSVDEAWTLASKALNIAEDRADVRALAQAHNILGILARSSSDLPTARHHLEQSLALAESLDDPGIRAASLNNLALLYGAMGDIDQAIALTRTALELCASLGDRHREAAAHSNLADFLHSAARHDEAMTHIKQSVSIMAEIDAEGGSPQPEIWKLIEW